MERELLGPTLGIFRFEFDGGVPEFEAGQYLTLGLPVDGKLVWRPYSVASAPEQRGLVEFLVRWVVHPVEGAFTTQLGRLGEGDTVQWRGPRGHFTLRDRFPDGAPDRRRLLLVAAGTGVAPFVSYVAHLQATEDGREVVLLHGSSHADELAYRASFEQLAARGRLRYLPTVSRPDEECNRDWHGAAGRVQRWLEPAEAGQPWRVERELGLELSPADTIAHLCGPEGMVDAAREVLAARGFRDARHPHPDGRHDLLWEAYG